MRASPLLGVFPLSDTEPIGSKLLSLRLAPQTQRWRGRHKACGEPTGTRPCECAVQEAIALVFTGDRFYL
ncbi:MAG: hypothetical protein AAFY16_07170 [Cyanobacteria bacterium J06642_3]